MGRWRGRQAQALPCRVTPVPGCRDNLGYDSGPDLVVNGTSITLMSVRLSMMTYVVRESHKKDLGGRHIVKGFLYLQGWGY